jgi:hypothetical protein
VDGSFLLLTYNSLDGLIGSEKSTPLKSPFNSNAPEPVTKIPLSSPKAGFSISSNSAFSLGAKPAQEAKPAEKNADKLPESSPFNVAPKPEARKETDAATGKDEEVVKPVQSTFVGFGFAGSPPKMSFEAPKLPKDSQKTTIEPQQASSTIFLPTNASVQSKSSPLSTSPIKTTKKDDAEQTQAVPPKLEVVQAETSSPSEKSVPGSPAKSTTFSSAQPATAATPDAYVLPMLTKKKLTSKVYY